MPLQTVLVVPFVLQISLAVGLTGWFSFQNGQAAVNDFATRLRDDATARIQGKLETYLETPHLINRLNANAIRLKQLDLQNPDDLERHFWSQMQIFTSVNSISIGLENGEFVAAGIPGEGKTLFVARAGSSTGQQFHIYEMDANGNRGRLVRRAPTYDPRLRPWYQTAVQTRQPIWSEIYTDFAELRLTITATYPLYSKQGRLEGVLANDLVLSRVGQFLRDIRISQTGETFILERSGLLVATSTAENPFLAQHNQVKRMTAASSQSPLIRSTADYLTQHFQDLHRIQGPQRLKFDFQGEQRFLQVTPLQDKYGLDWLIVVVLPEKDFTERIQNNNRLTAFLCLAALLLASAIGIRTSAWITRPILQLSDAAKAFSQGKGAQLVPVNRQDELGMLAQTFNQMQTQLGRERRLFTGGPVVIFRWAIQQPWQVEYVSANVVQFGYQPDDLLSGKISYASIVHREDIPRIQAELDQYSIEDVNAFEQDYRIIRPDGEIRWVYDFTVRVRNAQGQVTHHDGYVLDITERKQAEQQVQELNKNLEQQVEERTAELQQKVQELQDLYQRQDEFLHAVSHDLRTPLTGTLLVLRNLLETPQEHQEGLPIYAPDSSISLSPASISVSTKLLDRMIQSSDRQLRLINALLETHASEMRGIPLQLEPVHLEKLVQSTMEDMESLLIQNQATLTYQIPADLAPIMADLLQLRRVFENLLTNALNHNPPGLHLTIQADLEGPMMLCAVQDDGIGMSQEQCDRMFERYARGNRSRSTGLGLGLYLCRQIIAAHGGQIGVISSPGSGAKFWFKLPLGTP
ncbi:hypothetical protein BST81_18855 [Leptolyngbya sp. 'hensonii']|nr:hypothetical protein BST81_18855 [Leptolyngbya sp. 'hensonii']